jgi:polyisoprenoid-binding protein YceI
MRFLLAALLIVAAPLASASTTTWTHTAGSSLGFASSYDGESFDGRFSQFTTAIAFDPATATGRFDVVIALASAGTENEERDETLLGADFFNASAMPRAAPKLEGSATVKRLDFGIGTGDWDDVEVMPDAVSVTTALVLQPKR